MKTATLIALIAAVASVNVWGFVIWRELEFSTRDRTYDYKTVSPNDDRFDWSMSLYGEDGWKAESCRRATSSFGGGASYECIMSREHKARSGQ